MTPLLLCTYRGRYLELVLRSLREQGVPQSYPLFVWDNGGAAEVCRRQGVRRYGLASTSTGEVVNVGKALGMRHLVDVAREELPQASCYLCMDDDVIVDRAHLDALVAAARRPGLGMIGGRFHPFNSTMPFEGHQPALVDPCPACVGGRPAVGVACARCGGSGKDPQGLRLRVFPAEDRTVRGLGRVAGTLFAIATASLTRLPWGPYLYPVQNEPASGKPFVYWPEDAALDCTLTQLGYVNGYLDDPALTLALHLPELNTEYLAWKVQARARQNLRTENPF